MTTLTKEQIVINKRLALLSLYKRNLAKALLLSEPSVWRRFRKADFDINFWSRVLLMPRANIEQGIPFTKIPADGWTEAVQGVLRNPGVEEMVNWYEFYNNQTETVQESK